MEPLNESLKSESILSQTNDNVVEFNLGGDLSKDGSDGTSDVSVFVLNETVIETKTTYNIEEVQTQDRDDKEDKHSDDKVKDKDKDKTDGRGTSAGTFKLRLTSTLRNKRIQAVAVSLE